MEYIAFDSHKRYTFAVVTDESGRIRWEGKIHHARGSIRAFLEGREPGSVVALEAVGNWYWIVDEIEAAGCLPQLVHALKAKLMYGCVNKTDKLDARGLNKLQRIGVLPTVWIPPGKLRDKRELCRARMVLVHYRSRLKQRVHSTLDKYGITIEASDIFGKKGRALMAEAIDHLPEETRRVTKEFLHQIDELDKKIGMVEERMKEILLPTKEVKLLMSLPGVGFILATTMALEIGDVGRFPTAEHLASYAGVVPKVHSSGGKSKHKGLRKESNKYLKWAYIEAANVVGINHKRKPFEHVSKLYKRIKGKKGHHKAVGAVARHLAEASYWVLRKGESYKDPLLNKKIGELGA